jgi:hypothetical protein
MKIFWVYAIAAVMTCAATGAYVYEHNLETAIWSGMNTVVFVALAIRSFGKTD